MVTRVEQLPLCQVAEFEQPLFDTCAVVVEPGAQEPPDVLSLDCARGQLLDEVEERWEQVALVLVPELLPGDAEWGTGHSARHEVDLREAAGGLPGPQVTLVDPVRPSPLAPVVPQGLTRVDVEFDER